MRLILRNRLSRPLIRTDTSLDRESKAFHCIHYHLSRHRETLHTTASVASCRDTERRCIPLHPLPVVETLHQPVSKLSCPWESMEAAKLLHALCPHQFSVHVLHTNVADKNRYYTSIHPRIRTDQNCAVLKRAENIMRHVEMWSVVRQKETVRASEEDVLKVEGFSHKIVQFHQ